MKVCAVIVAALLFVACAYAARPNRGRATVTAKRVFGKHWRKAACIAWQESRDELTARNGESVLGPWQINTRAHPWVNRRLLTRSWTYSAAVAYVISEGGRDWSQWSTAGLC